MKKSAIFLLTLLLVSLLTACGEKAPETVDVDLTEFYTTVETEYEWGDGYMTDIEGELLENFYPGMGDITTKQFLAKMPMMSAVVNEVAFAQCETEEDAAKVAAIFQSRIDTQAEGGAWYPESMETWSHGTVIQQGTYVAMIASGEYQEDLTEKFNALFAA